MLKYSVEKKTFVFKNPSGTSRGVLTEKTAWFIYLWDDNNPEIIGIGECSVIPNLSVDFQDQYSYEKSIHYFINSIIEKISLNKQYFDFPEFIPSLKQFPSILFGIETAFIDLQNGGKKLFFDTAFTRGEKSIPINGLVWMGDEEFVQQQIEEKLNEEYSCIKMKIGALGFEKEYQILKQLRDRFSSKKLILRVDANGAFDFNDAQRVLDLLAELDLHSIEQPIKAGNWKQMAFLCSNTNLPIALDEELIGVHAKERKVDLLDEISPQYIILKPSLHGGIIGTQEWIRLAEEREIFWWITSALESNIGLNAIAQFTSMYENPLHQGLGTGNLYVENFPTKLQIQKGEMFMNKK